MKSNSSDLFTNASASSETGSIIRPILRNRPTNTSNLNISQSSSNSSSAYVADMDTSSMRLNLLKVDMYPDPYRHITTTILEYPETKLNNNKRAEDKETKLKNEKAKRMNRRNNLRYMTQPVTLIEIKEIEEDSLFNTAAAVANQNINSNTNVSNTNTTSTSTTTPLNHDADNTKTTTTTTTPSLSLVHTSISTEIKS